MTKTEKYLSHLNSRETKALINFIASPYFNSDTRLCVLLNEILNNKKFDEAVVFKKVTGKKYSKEAWRHLNSDLNILIEKFLVVHANENNKLGFEDQLVRTLHDKKLNKYAKQHQVILQELIDKSAVQDAEMQIEKLKADQLAYTLAGELEDRSQDSQLQRLSDSIDVSFFALKLRYACEMINRSNVLQTNYELRFLKEIIAFLYDSPLLKLPAIGLYFHIYKTLTEADNEEHYHTLRSELVKNKNSFTPKEYRDMFTFAQNYCIRQLNKGKTAYLEELFRNYSYLLEEKILLVDQQLSQFNFKNVVTIALRLQKFQWAEKFIEEYAKFLPAEDRENAKIYNLARLRYATGDQRTALKLMQNVEFTDLYYHLDAKALLIKIYFDQNSFESFTSLFTSFGNYLKRNKRVSAYQRDTYMNFLKASHQLFNYKLFGKGSTEKTESFLSATQNIADINWLKQKLSEVAD